MDIGWVDGSVSGIKCLQNNDQAVYPGTARTWPTNTWPYFCLISYHSSSSSSPSPHQNTDTTILNKSLSVSTCSLPAHFAQVECHLVDLTFFISSPGKLLLAWSTHSFSSLKATTVPRLLSLTVPAACQAKPERLVGTAPFPEFLCPTSPTSVTWQGQRRR